MIYKQQFCDQFGNDCAPDAEGATPYDTWRLSPEEARDAVSDFVIFTEGEGRVGQMTGDEFAALVDSVRISYEDRDHDSWFQCDYPDGRGEGNGMWYSVTEYCR